MLTIRNIIRKNFSQNRLFPLDFFLLFLRFAFMLFLFFAASFLSADLRDVFLEGVLLMVCLIAKNTGRNGSTRCEVLANLFVSIILSKNYAWNPNLKGCQSLVVHRIDRITDNFCVNMFNAHYSISQKGRLFIKGNIRV